MSNQPKEVDKILDQFFRAQSWLMSLITDPMGKRYSEEKTKEQRMQEFKEYIDRMANYLEFTGKPQTKFNSVHVAGTSGKGSVTVMLSSILSASGIKTGHHISPYLQVCNEKLIVDGRLIRPSEFSQVVDEFKVNYLEWQAANRKYKTLKYGEAWVALTYYWFARQAIEWGVVETGLGGRYDPTNVIPSKLAVITNIDYDHLNALGPELKNIAWHKAGIIQPGKPVITAEQKPEIVAVLTEEADQKEADLFRLGKDFDYSIKKFEGNGRIVLNVDTPFGSYQNIKLSMLGNHQAENAAVAITSADVLREIYGLPISIESVRQGLETLIFPGRFELVQHGPIVVLDGAHNPHKAVNLAKSLRSIYPDKKIIMIVGVLSTKNGTAIIKALSPVVDLWIVTEPHVYGKPSLPIGSLVSDIQGKSSKPIYEAKSVGAALDVAFEQAAADDVIVVTGSLYLVGEARDRWYPQEQILVEIEASGR